MSMLNFTVGPVMMSEEIKKVGGEDIPYFRTEEFSKIMLENESLLKKYFKAENDARIITLTGSGTAAMDAAVSNTLDNTDKILVINGGSFGHRFVEICQTYELNYTEIKCQFGKTLTKEQLYKYDNKGYTALLVNLDETSSGVLYDIEMISDFCKKNDIFLIVDSISSFLCDPFNMKRLGVDLVITGSQKALAIAPGISIICVNSKAITKINNSKVKSYYLNLKSYLTNGERGQTPFTPAVGTILELNKRLHIIENNGGVDAEIERISHLAKYFREKIKELPFELFADKMSNAVTALELKNKNISAHKLFETIKNEYNVFVCPNGGEYKDKVFRVGHIGHIQLEDIDKLIEIIKDLVKRGILS